MKNKVIIGCIVGFMFLAAGTIRLFYQRTNSDSQSSIKQGISEHQKSATPKVSKVLQHRSKYTKVRDRFDWGDSFSTTLSRHNVSAGDIHYISQAAKKVTDIRKIVTGTPITLCYKKDSTSLDRITVRIDKRHRLIIDHSEEESWTAVIEEIQTTTSNKQAHATITDSLWQAAVNSDVPPSVILDMADLFGWSIDFASSLRKGDAFSLIYEMEEFPDGETAPGSIVSAKFTNKSKDYHAFHYTLPDGKSDYYDMNGDSVRRAFLKSPLRYRYISSGFSNNRFHPILKIYRPHHGIDYAAPSGTPVSALGDGIVIFSGRKGGYGNYVQVKHGDAYVTCYAHLSRYAKGVRKGTKVKQGQTIAYVGSTGLSTGPHLDFRVKYRGKFINPLHMKSPPTDPVPQMYLDDFISQRDKYLTKLKLLSVRGVRPSLVSCSVC